MILFRHADPRFPFLWETASQPAGRWHAPGEGPVHYLADTPDGAWAEFLRHEEIRDPEDLAGIRRVQEGLREGPDRDGQVYVIFGRRPDLVGWPVTFVGSPPEYLLGRVRHLTI